MRSILEGGLQARVKGTWPRRGDRAGVAEVQAGAQGEHKLSRGYEPVVTRSAHYIPNPSFRTAVSDFLEGERAAIATEIEWLRRDLPYRSSP